MISSSLDIEIDLKRLVSSWFINNESLIIPILLYFLLNYFDKIIAPLIFPNRLKLTIITPTYEKYSRNNKRHYRPVSVLRNISKVFENILYQQIPTHFENVISKQQTSFHWGFNAQYSIFVVLKIFQFRFGKVGTRCYLQICQIHFVLTVSICYCWNLLLLVFRKILLTY